MEVVVEEAVDWMAEDEEGVAAASETSTSAVGTLEAARAAAACAEWFVRMRAAEPLAPALVLVLVLLVLVLLLLLLAMLLAVLEL